MFKETSSISLGSTHTSFNCCHRWKVVSVNYSNRFRRKEPDRQLFHISHKSKQMKQQDNSGGGSSSSSKRSDCNKRSLPLVNSIATTTTIDSRQLPSIHHKQMLPPSIAAMLIGAIVTLALAGVLEDGANLWPGVKCLSANEEFHEMAGASSGAVNHEPANNEKPFGE